MKGFANWLVDNLGGILLCLGIVVLAVLFGWADTQELQQWNTFSVEHHCRVVEYREGKTYGTWSSSGNYHSTTESDQTTYLCDDGVRYTR